MAACALTLAACGEQAEDPPLPRLQSRYLVAADGTRLAADVWLPAGSRSTARLPAVLRMTRYHRAQANPGGKAEEDTNAGEAAFWNGRGYALVIVDARGTGASFGVRRGELADTETADFRGVVDWTTAQPWSNGRVAAYGASYDADAAERLAASGHPAVKAAGLLFPDFDLYSQLLAPGGVPNRSIEVWGRINALLDGLPGARQRLADTLGVAPAELPTYSPKPVDGSDGAALAAQAIAEHAANLDLGPVLADPATTDTSDARLPDGRRLDEMSMLPRLAALAAARTALFVRAGWLDAGTAEGALMRFGRLPNDMDILIGHWTHGFGGDADPFALPGRAATPSMDSQFLELADFFDRHVRDGQVPTGQRRLRIATMGQNGLQEVNRWPPADTQDERLALHPGRELMAADEPGQALQAQVAPVSSAGTGLLNRWWTQLDSDDIDYGDRSPPSSTQLHFTGPALASARTLQGSPRVGLQLRSQVADAAVHVLLEAVAPDGRGIYLSEALLRLSHRNTAAPDPAWPWRLARSFARADRQPMPLDSTQPVELQMFPVVARIPAGYRLRLVVMAEDAPTFAPLTPAGAPLALLSGPGQASVLSLPWAR